MQNNKLVQDDTTVKRLCISATLVPLGPLLKRTSLSRQTETKKELPIENLLQQKPAVASLSRAD